MPAQGTSRRLATAASAASLVVMAALLAVLQPPEKPQVALAEPVPPPPELHGTVQSELSGLAEHAYSFKLAAGQYLHLVVDQQGVDLAVTLVDPAGKTLVEVDHLDGAWGPEDLYWIAARAGRYHLQLRSLHRKEAGRYRATIESLRPPTERDRRRVEAAAAFQRAATLSSRGGPENLRAAVAAYDTALAQWHDLGDGLQEALSAVRLGRTYFDLGEVASALHCYERSLELLQTSEFRGQEAGALASIAPAYRLSGQLERALAANQRALEIYRDLKSARGQASSLNSLAVVHQDQGEIEKALELYERALALWQQLDEPANQGYALHSMGTLYALLGKDAESLDLLNRALEIRRRTGNRANQAVTLSAIGWGHYLLGEPEAAVRYLEEALRLRRAVGDRRGEATTLDRLATALVQLDRRPQALAAYQQAETLLRQSGDRGGLANTLANLGLLYEGWSRPRRALLYFQEALPLLAEVGDRNAEAAALTGLTRAQRALGDLAAARRSLERALELLESLRRTSDRVGLQTSFLASRYDTYELYVDLLMELGCDARALEVAEGARAQGLLTMLRDVHAEIGKQVDPGLLERRRALGEKVNAAAAPAETRSLLLELEKLRAEVRRQSPGYAALTDPEPLSVEEVRREMLDRETALLYFALGEERSFVWLLTPDSLVSRVLPPRREIEAAARRTHDLLAGSHQRPARTQARAAMAKLAEMLLGPLADRLDSRRLWLVPDGALHYVPFGALPLPPHPLAPSPSLPSATGRRGTRRGEDTSPSSPGSGEEGWGGEGLLADHEIVRVPSLAVLLALRREVASRRPAPRLLAVLADPVFGGRFPPLAQSRAEADAILALVPPEDRLAALGFEASRETVLSGTLSRYRILHFATHALLDAEQPELSGIVFSQVDEAGRPRNGFLRAHEIYDLELPAELVVLSACQTALGKELRGEGLVGLAGGLMYAGASRVVVSLWSVSDRATAELMQRFYRGMLEQGLPPAAALRQAQLSMAQEPHWRAPYFWAGFVVLGEREGCGRLTLLERAGSTEVRKPLINPNDAHKEVKHELRADQEAKRGRG